MSNKKFDDPTNVDVDVRWKKSSKKKNKKPKENHPNITMDKVGDEYLGFQLTSNKYDKRRDKYGHYYSVQNIELDFDPLGTNQDSYVRNCVIHRKTYEYDKPAQKGKLSYRNHKKLKQKVNAYKAKHYKNKNK